MIELKLPFPPTTNQIWRKFRGQMTLSPEYREWKERAGWELKSQHPKTMKSRAVIWVDLDDTRRGDCDNRMKPLLDLLVEHGVLAGDSKKYVERVSIGWSKISECRVAISEA